MTRPATLPAGLWPPRMPAATAAAYCGEVSVDAFLGQVRRGTYPAPVVKQGRRQIWAKADLDRAIQPAPDHDIGADVALDL
ncbi:hypothetical protein ACQR1Y_11895 [Bradyrhizobium sp. HKCCYLRH3099]|uniref:hypothetical protein n=1 Tax=unclassified Bradyrhizobium TaxID=2631580 RepID=UPI003EB9CC6F